MKEYPDKERALWAVFDTTPFELRTAKDNMLFHEVLDVLNVAGYYEKMRFALPENINKILDDFTNEKFIKRNDSGSYDITNLGALLISKNLKNFESLAHKSVRVILV